MNAIADNIANINTIKPYRPARVPGAVHRRRRRSRRSPATRSASAAASRRVAIAVRRRDRASSRYDPANPLADKDGLVRSPDIDLGRPDDRPDHRPARVPAEPRGRRPRQRVVPASHRHQRDGKRWLSPRSAALMSAAGAATDRARARRRRTARGADAARPARRRATSATSSSNALAGLQDTQNNANSLAVQAATGDLTDIHNYTIAATEASLHDRADRRRA